MICGARPPSSDSFRSGGAYLAETSLPLPSVPRGRLRNRGVAAPVELPPAGAAATAAPSAGCGVERSELGAVPVVAAFRFADRLERLFAVLTPFDLGVEEEATGCIDHALTCSSLRDGNAPDILPKLR